MTSRIGMSAKGVDASSLSISAPGCRLSIQMALLVLVCAAGSAWCDEAPAAGLPLLTTVKQVRQMSEQEAQRHYPVHFRAAVTYADDQNLFVQDGTAGIWVDIPFGAARPQYGQLLELEGTTQQEDFAPDIGHVTWRVLGAASMPEPLHPTYDRMMSTAEDAKWVEIEGTVRSVDEVKIWKGLFVRMSLAIPGGRIMVEAPVSTAAPAGLVDSTIRVRGVCGTLANSDGQVIGVMIEVPDASHLEVVKAAPPDPFSIPARPIVKVLRFTFSGNSDHRVRVRGTVTANLPGTGLFISDASGNIYLETGHSQAIHPGDRIDVVGFTAVTDSGPVLQNTVFRLISNGSAPVPRKVSVTQALVTQQNTLISIEGTLTAVGQLANENEFGMPPAARQGFLSCCSEWAGSELAGNGSTSRGQPGARDRHLPSDQKYRWGSPFAQDPPAFR